MKATFSRPLWTTLTNCVRVCSISALLSFFSLVPCSARADESEPLGAVEFDAETLQAVTNLARSVSGVNATAATLEDNVAAILALMQGIAQTAGPHTFKTYPFYNQAVGGNLGAAMARIFTDAAYSATALPAASKSYLYQLQRSLYGQAGSPVSADALIPTLLRVEALLRTQPAYTNDLDTINGALFGIIDSLSYYFPLIRDNTYNAANDLNYLLAGWVGGGQYDNTWDVALRPEQMYEFQQMFDALQGTSGSYGDMIVGAIDDATRTNAAISGDLHALRLGLLDEYDTIDTVEEHVDTVTDYVDEDIETNALAALTISPGDAGDLSPVLDLVDPDAFDVLPSLTGGDPVVQVFTASRDSNLPAFSIDFSLPSGFRTFVHAVCVWIWRLLFFLAMWRLVNEEYGYWSTLGGSAG